MTLIDLKNFITNKIVPSDFMIFVSKDCPFLANQYVKALGELSPGGINKINSIYEPLQSSLMLLAAPVGAVNVMTVDTFEERSEDYSQFENTIVVCEQVSKDIVKNVEKYIIKFPKLTDWQLFDYAKTICPNIDDEDLQWLVNASDCDINRVINELNKVSLFSKSEQKEVFAAVRFDPQSDLYKADLFNVVNALVAGDMQVLFDFIKHDGDEIHEPVVLANRTLSSLKNIILIARNPQLSAADLGVSPGQFNFIKNRYKSLNVEAIKYKIKFLSNFDLLLKTSQLDLNKRDMLSYLISNLNFRITN